MHISKKIPVKISGGSASYIQFTKDIKPIQLYETVIKPKLLNTARTVDCYRTYKLNNIKNMKIVAYKLDVIENEIRRQIGLTKHQLKSSELYKLIEEENIKTETDNVRVEEPQTQTLGEYLMDADILKKGGLHGLKYDKQGKRKENQ